MDLELVRTNARTAYPLIGLTGDVKVASFNVLNYFDGPDFPTSRGATNEFELVRQEAKIVAALAAMDADVVGLVEVENDGHGEDSAIATLTAAVNAEMGGDVYSYVSISEALGTEEVVQVLPVIMPIQVMDRAVGTHCVPMQLMAWLPL